LRIVHAVLYGGVTATREGRFRHVLDPTRPSWYPTASQVVTLGKVLCGGPQSDYDFVQAGTGLVTCGDGQTFRADAVWEWSGTDSGVVRSSASVTYYC